MQTNLLKRWLSKSFTIIAILLAVYLVLAYLVAPILWRHYEHNPAMENDPKTTEAGINIPGDPLNVALVGTEDEVIKALLAAGWYPADSLSFKSSMGIAKSVLFNQPDPKAPVSNLFLWGRHQDFAFELPAGTSAKHRNHVRFWKSPETAEEGRTLWLGAATFDKSVGVSHTTGEITHHIAPDIDTERDKLIGDLTRASQLSKIYQVTGVGVTFTGRNGGGDWYYTDGEMTVGVVSKENVVLSQPPIELPDPPAVALKNKTWTSVSEFSRRLFQKK